MKDMSANDEPAVPGPGVDTREDLFEVASRLPEGERKRYLDEACGCPEQRARVDQLLEAARKADEFFDDLEPKPAPPPATERPGSMIGPYKLLQEIGEGGFGTVFMAEQRAPILRRVALKVVKQGMDTRNVVARFEAERQALAMMDHPNIAKVFDAGTTPSGRPYFVMELVKGVPVTRFCNEQKFDTGQRLELFLDICSAINHAHQKGIIHRDLKPGNILVSLHGDRAVPKIIDFGIAKATQQPLTEKTLFTRFEQMVGTPLYMSPEQAASSGQDVDTRTDIYALGVLLYELLVGKPPFDGSTLLAAGYDEMRRIIRDEDPPRPSTRVSTLADNERSVVATTHRTDVERLGRLIRGDLDWIIMKAIEKDRTRRYETANGFALDIRRYLHEEPVRATPPSTGYKLRKFVRRNRAACGAAAAVLGALLLGAAGTTWGMLREREAAARAEEAARDADSERRRAETELARASEIKGLLVALLHSAGPEVAGGADTRLLEGLLHGAAERLERDEVEDPLVAAELHDVIGDVYSSLGKFREAENHFNQALELYAEHEGPQSTSSLSVRGSLGLLYNRTGRQQEAEAIFRHNMTAFGGEKNRLRSQTNLAFTLLSQQRYPEARDILIETLERKEPLLGESDPDTLRCLNNLAIAHFHLGLRKRSQGDPGGAEKEFDEALKRWRMVVDRRSAHPQIGPRHPETLGSRNNVANALEALGRLGGPRELIDLRREVYTDARVILQDAPTHPFRVTITFNLVEALRESGRTADLEEARDVCLEFITRATDSGRPPDHPKLLDARDELREVLVELGDLDAAEEVVTETLGILRAALDHDPRGQRQRAALVETWIDRGHLEHATRSSGRRFFDSSPKDPGTQASLERELGYYEEAIGVALGLRDQRHAALLKARVNKASTLYECGRREAARDEALGIVRLAEDHPGVNVRLKREATMVLGATYVSLGEHEKAIRLLAPVQREMQASHCVACCRGIFEAITRNLRSARRGWLLGQWKARSTTGKPPSGADRAEDP